MADEWIDEAIRSAHERGMVAFVAVVPVSPRTLRDCPPEVVYAAVCNTAGDDLAKQVDAWYAENALEDGP